MRRSPLGIALLLASSAACGGSAEPPKTADVVVGKGAPARPRADEPQRGASKEIAARWAFRSEPEVVAYADLERLLATELVSGLVPALVQVAGSAEPAAKACIRELATSARELVGGFSEREGLLVVVRHEGDGVERACAPALGDQKPVALAGAKTYGSDGELIAFQPGYVTIGKRALVEASIAARSSAPVALRPGPDEQAVVGGAIDGRPFHGALSITPDHFRLTAAVTLGREDEAEGIERLATASRQRGLGEMGALASEPAAAATVKRLFDAFSIARDGKKLSVRFSLDEPTLEQARDIGTLATLSVFAVRKYIARSKEAEAKSAVGQISKDLVSWYESEALDAKGHVVPHHKKRLFSLPPVPKTVPRAVKVVTSQQDWSGPWARIRFEMAQPQYYQYEVVAAKDGKSADIVARGDLDGDGKTSTFKLHVALEGDRLVTAPNIEETDPDE